MRRKTALRAGVLTLALLLCPSAQADAASLPRTASWADAVGRLVGSTWGGFVRHILLASEEATEANSPPEPADADQMVPGSNLEDEPVAPKPSTEGGPEWDPDGSS